MASKHQVSAGGPAPAAPTINPELSPADKVRLEFKKLSPEDQKTCFSHIVAGLDDRTLSEYGDIVTKRAKLLMMAPD